MKLARRFRRGSYVGSGENYYWAVHFDDLADLYCVALKKATAGTILHAVSENVSAIELAAAIHRGYGFKGEPSGMLVKDARRFIPYAERLTCSHALSGDRACSLGWRSFRDSILKDIERIAREEAFLARHEAARPKRKEK